MNDDIYVNVDGKMEPVTWCEELEVVKDPYKKFKAEMIRQCRRAWDFGFHISNEIEIEGEKRVIEPDYIPGLLNNKEISVILDGVSEISINGLSEYFAELLSEL